MKKNISIDGYKDILKSDPDNQVAKQNIVNHYIKNGNTQKAIKFLEECLQKNRYDILAYFILGNIFLSAEDYKKALQNYSRARHINPRSPDINNNLGMVYYKLRSFKEASNYFMECIKIKPDHYIAYCNIAKIHFKERNYEEAINFYSKALKFSSDHKESIEGIGKSYYKIDKFDLAIKYLSELTENKRDDESLLNLTGVCYFNTGKMKEAIDCFTRSLEINPNSIELHRKICLSFQRIDKNSDKGIKYALQLLELDKNSDNSLDIFSKSAGKISKENIILKDINFKKNLVSIYQNENIDSTNISNITLEIIKDSILSKGVDYFII